MPFVEKKKLPNLFSENNTRMERFTKYSIHCVGFFCIFVYVLLPFVFVIMSTNGTYRFEFDESCWPTGINSQFQFATES